MSTLAATFHVSSAQRRAAVFAAFGLFVLLALVAHRDGVRLSFDSYYYVEYAKLFRLQPPGSFGTAWPFGWPLLGAATGWLGLSAYQGLLTCSGLSVLGLVALASRVLPWERLGLMAGGLVLGAGAGTFILAVLVAGVLSEVPFALVLLAFALCLARWPETGAIVTSAGLALAAFALRYAGVVALVTLAGWLLLNWRPLRAAGRARTAWCSVGAAGLAAAGLLLWNLAATGKFTDHAPGGLIPPSAWPGIAADLGWALPAALGGLGLRDALGFGSSLRLPLGFGLLAAIVALGAFAWRRGATAETRALGVVTIGYATGLVALRCREEFDSLYNARMCVPLLFPLLLMAARLTPSRRLLVLGCGLLLAGNAALCIRGASRQIAGDVRAALPLVASVTAQDTIAVNDQAFTLSAGVRARVLRPGEPGWSAPAGGRPASRFIVLAAPPADRQGHSTRLAPEWETLAATLLARGSHASRLHTPGLIVLEHIDGRN